MRPAARPPRDGVLRALRVGPCRAWEGTRQPRKWAPVGAGCASPGLLAHAETADPPPCIGCGRGVVYPGARRSRRWVGCSQGCVSRASFEARPKPVATSTTGPAVVERWGARLKRLREARGMSRAELAHACIGRGRRIDTRDLHRYEEEDDLPRVPTFGALARALGVSMQTLLYSEREAERIAEEREGSDHSLPSRSL